MYSSRVGVGWRLAVRFARLAMCCSINSSVKSEDRSDDGGKSGWSAGSGCCDEMVDADDGARLVRAMAEAWTSSSAARGKSTGSLDAGRSSDAVEALRFLDDAPMDGVTGGDGRFMSDWQRLRSGEIGGRVLLESMVVKDCLGVAEAMEDGAEAVELKLSNGFASGGDIRLEKGGSRVVMVFLSVLSAVEDGCIDTMDGEKEERVTKKQRERKQKEEREGNEGK